jgi:hypothetical protein
MPSNYLRPFHGDHYLPPRLSGRLADLLFDLSDGIHRAGLSRVAYATRTSSRTLRGLLAATSVLAPDPGTRPYRTTDDGTPILPSATILQRIAVFLDRDADGASPRKPTAASVRKAAAKGRRK